jgi:hypothetical protein
MFVDARMSCVSVLQLDVYRLQSHLLAVKSIACLSESAVRSNKRLMNKINDFGCIRN